MGLVSKLRGLLGAGARLDATAAEARRAVKTSAEVGAKVGDVRTAVVALGDDVKELRREIKKMEAEVRERLLQYHLQLGRLARGRQDAAEPRLSGRAVPLAADADERLEWDTIGGDEPLPDPEGRLWLHLDACPACGGTDRTVVNEWNKLLLLPKAPDAAAVRYDYAICHACGLLFATRRPFGARYDYMLRHFGEVTGKRGPDGVIRNPLLNPLPLTDADRDELRRLAAAGVFVSDHLGLRTRDYIGGLLRDRVENSIHFDVIASLVALPPGARVLEVRSRAGTILDALRRLCGARVYAMPIWESQQFLLREVYGIETSDLIDFDRFAIPFDGQFDVIVCNHMLTHVVRPAAFFAEIRRCLAPGGHLYLHNEPDDAEFLEGPQSMIATLNPLHLQAFDQPTLVRVLAANGFRTVFVKARGDLKHMCLARYDGEVEWTPMSAGERDARIQAYQRARDRAVLGLRPELQPRVARVWSEAVERGVAAGIAEFDETGRLRLVAP